MTTLSPAFPRVQRELASSMAVMERRLNIRKAAVDGQPVRSLVMPFAQLSGSLGLATIAGIQAAIHQGSFLSVVLAGIAFMLVVAGLEMAGPLVSQKTFDLVLYSAIPRTLPN